MEYLLYLLPCIMLPCNCMFSLHKVSASSSNLKTFRLRIPLTVDMIIKESYDRIVSNAMHTYLPMKSFKSCNDILKHIFIKDI